MDISDIVISGVLIAIVLLLSIPLGLTIASRSHDMKQSDGILLGFVIWILSILLGGFVSASIFTTLIELGF